MIKIGRGIVRDMLEDTEDRAIVEGAVGLAHAVHCQVIAEDAWTRGHGAVLRQLGCELAKGVWLAPLAGLTARGRAATYCRNFCTAASPSCTASSWGTWPTPGSVSSVAFGSARR